VENLARTFLPKKADRDNCFVSRKVLACVEINPGEKHAPHPIVLLHVEIYVGIIHAEIFLTFEFFSTAVQKISFGALKKTIDLEFVVF